MTNERNDAQSNDFNLGSILGELCEVTRHEWENSRQNADHHQLMKVITRLSFDHSLATMDEWKRKLLREWDDSTLHAESTPLLGGVLGGVPRCLVIAYELMRVRIKDATKSRIPAQLERDWLEMVEDVIESKIGLHDRFTELATCEATDELSRGLHVAIESTSGSPMVKPGERYRLRIAADPNVFDEWLHVLVLQQLESERWIPLYPNLYDNRVPFVIPGVDLLIPDPVCAYDLIAPDRATNSSIRVIASRDPLNWPVVYQPGVTSHLGRDEGRESSISKHLEIQIQTLNTALHLVRNCPGYASLADTTLCVV